MSQPYDTQDKGTSIVNQMEKKLNSVFYWKKI